MAKYMAVKTPEAGLSTGFWSFSLVESSELNKGGARGGLFMGNRGAVFMAASRGATISVKRVRNRSGYGGEACRGWRGRVEFLVRLRGACASALRRSPETGVKWSSVEVSVVYMALLEGLRQPDSSLLR